MDAWDIDIENVAGIRAGAAAIYPGINVVQAENWQGKSSFIAAIETVMGTARPLTEGEDEANVRLETDDDRYEMSLSRSGEAVVAEGQPFITDEYDRVCADLYAFLDGSNEVRRAVRAGDNLEAVLTRPLDFENIDDRIADRQSLRSRVVDELERAREAAADIPGLQETVEDHESELAALRQRRAELVDRDEDRIDGSHDELSAVRAERDQVAGRIDRLEASIERAESTLADRRDALASLADDDLEDVSTELAAERDALEAVERDVELLQSTYAAAKRLVDEDRFDLLADVEHGLMADTATCLLCGNEVNRDEFVDHLDAIGDVVAELRGEAADHQERIDELQASQAAIEDRRRRRTSLETEIADLEGTVSEREESLALAVERRSALDDRVSSLAAEVEAVDSELTEVDSEIKYLEAELEDARTELESRSETAATRDRLEREREELTAEIEALRSRKERMKRRAREAFDEAMADLLDRFDTGFETARVTGSFDLVVAREGREASLEALSEGELELLGLVAAIAGHQAFEVAEAIPLLLLDDLGGLSDESLHTVVGMLETHADRVVVTAYPEHSAFDGHVIDPTEWAVVSDTSRVGARP